MALILLASKRYLKWGKSTGFIIHVIVAMFIVVVTMVRAFQALAKKDWKLPEFISPHVVIGLALLTLVFVQPILGWLAFIMGKCNKPKKWRKHTETHTKIGKAHRYIGYFVLFLGIMATSSGLDNY